MSVWICCLVCGSCRKEPHSCAGMLQLECPLESDFEWKFTVVFTPGPMYGVMVQSLLNKIPFSSELAIESDDLPMKNKSTIPKLYPRPFYFFIIRQSLAKLPRMAWNLQSSCLSLSKIQKLCYKYWIQTLLITYNFISFYVCLCLPGYRRVHN